MSVLLTGFRPWGRIGVNPSGEVASALGGHVLPVDYDRAAREVLRLIRTERPEAILMLGLAEGRRRIGLEALALNVDHCEEGRYRRWRRPIDRGPRVLESRLPLDGIHRRLSLARIPVSISYSAGTFVCNHVFREALTHSRVPCGFVHLPPTRRISLERQLRAVRLILDMIK